MLTPYRILDLTDSEELLAAKLLGDLGADVIKIENPDGSLARRIGPFYHDEIDLEKSLFWFAFNTSKRGITLDIETADGREIFKTLVKGADCVFESFPPGYMEKLGLGYKTLESINPGVVLVSISPFGQSGPYAHYKASDIVSWAMGGEMYVTGDADRPPVRISYHSQARMHAAVEASVGAAAALYYRAINGEGQHIDVSVQECVVQVAHQFSTMPWDTNGILLTRAQQSMFSDIQVTRLWACQDGYVVFSLSSGVFGVRNNIPLFELMESKGMGDDYLRSIDWDKFSFTTTTQKIVDRLEEPIRKFFLKFSKAELLELGVKHRVQVYPVATAADVQESVQLASRDYWVDIEHPELGDTIRYPGAFVTASETPIQISQRAPFLGEHNREVYEKELGFSDEQIMALKQAGVI